jgi:putative phosphoribosyl transferase
MLFKDRKEAGEKLAEKLLNEGVVAKNQIKKTVVVSLLKGGIILGDIIAKKLKINHLPLPVAKIPTSTNPELALGALTFHTLYLDKETVSFFGKINLQNQINQPLSKLTTYQKKFKIKESDFNQIKNKTIILVDDGIATSSTVKAACLFLKKKGAKKIILASPVAPADFDEKGFDEVIILHKDPFLSAISQYYQDFSPIEDEQVKNLLNKKTS